MDSLNGFQILGLAGVAFAILLIGAAYRRGRVSRFGLLLWIAVWGAGGWAIAVPEATARVARWLGIGRGADLVFYLAILAALFGFLTAFLRFRRLDSELTALTREIALLRARIERAGADESDGPPQ